MFACLFDSSFVLIGHYGEEQPETPAANRSPPHQRSRELRHTFIHLLIRSHQSLVHWLCTVRFTHALRCAHSFTCSLTHSRAHRKDVFCYEIEFSFNPLCPSPLPPTKAAIKWLWTYQWAGLAGCSEQRSLVCLLAHSLIRFVPPPPGRDQVALALLMGGIGGVLGAALIVLFVCLLTHCAPSP